MNGNSILREVSRLRAERQSIVIQRSPKLRTDIHDHSLVLSSLFFKGELLALAYGSLSEKPHVLLRTNPTNKEMECRFFLALSDVLNEYFIRAYDAGSHPQIIVSSDEDIRNFDLLSRHLISFSSDVIHSAENDKIRHLGRLLAYPFIERSSLFGQQVVIPITHIIDDHFSLPLPETSCWIPSVVLSVFLSQSVHQPMRIHLSQALSDLSSTNSSSGSPALEHMISNILRGFVLPLYESLSSSVSCIIQVLPNCCDHLNVLHNLESQAFNDYMVILRHHLQRLRLQEGVTREETASRFLSFRDRPFFQVRRLCVSECVSFQILSLMIIHDPLYRAACRLDGRILVGCVEKISTRLILLIESELPVWIGVGREVQGVDGGEGVIESITILPLGYRITLSWLGPQFSISSFVDFIAKSSFISFDYMTSLVARRLGKARSGEPWTHRSDIPSPSGLFRPHREDLAGYIESAFL